MAVDTASAMVKVARRISGSRNISRGISESSPRISHNNSSISRGISDSSPRTSGTSNVSDRKTAVPAVSAATSAAAARTAFMRGMSSITRLFQVWSTRAFSVRVPCSTPHTVFLNRTRAHKLLLIHILETTPILGAGLLHHHSQPPRRRTRMDRPFHPSRPRALSPNRPPWRNLRHQASCAYRVQAS